MALTQPQINECAAELIDFAAEHNIKVDMHDTQLVRQNVIAIDTWVDSIQTPFNNCLTASFKAAATLKAKTLLLVIVLRKRAKLL